MQSRAVIRTAVIVVFTALAMVSNGFDILLPWHPFSTYGFSALPRGNITTVDAVARKSGLHAGDRIDVARASASDRFRIGFLSLAPEGSVMRVALVSGRIVSLTSHRYVRSTADNATDILAVVSLWIYIVIAALLVLLRPTPATWAFFFFAFSSCYTGVLIDSFAPFGIAVASRAIGVTALAAAGAVFVSFALRFPNARPAGAAKTFERAVLFGMLPALALWSATSYLVYMYAGALQPPWLTTAQQILQFGMYAVGVVILPVRYVLADAANRNRLQWMVAAFAIAFLPVLVTYFVETAMGIFPQVWIVNLAQVWELIAPIALAYTVLKHRLFDIRFVFSRALMYALMTSLTVGLLALADWGFGRWLAQSRFALIAELALALSLGIVLTTVHRHVERILNSVIFRARALALQALRRFAQETDLITDPQRLVMQTHQALNARLESEYAAIYTADGGSYVLASPGHGGTPALLPGDDFAVLRLRRWSEPFECDEPDHPLRAALLVPMVARGQLVGFIACGPKRDRTHYLPDEIETLSTLAHRAGSAYGWLTMRPAFDALAAPVTNL
jgi:hypothetical protein